MNYGFIGAGNMAGAIIKGMTIGTKSFDGKDIYACALHKSTTDKLAEECGINSCETASEVTGITDPYKHLSSCERSKHCQNTDQDQSIYRSFVLRM